jgi:hypothetical protein
MFAHAFLQLVITRFAIPFHPSAEAQAFRPPVPHWLARARAENWQTKLSGIARCERSTSAAAVFPEASGIRKSGIVRA